MCCVIGGLLFFFFKQKTAYEMRISDWSSDVCSSDLDLFADDGVAIGRDDADLGDLVRTGDGLGTRLQVLDDLGDGQIDAELQVHRVHAGGKIGRASCRERVCQYV